MGVERLITGTFIFTVFLFLMLFQVQEVVAQNLRICEAGLNNCEKFIKDKDKYKDCLQEQCSQQATDIKSYFEITDAYENIEYIETCDYGLRMCESLSDDKLAYWECVRHSCENQPATYELNCPQANGKCNQQLTGYYNCMEFYCSKDDKGQANQCYKGKVSCEGALRAYWQCVYGICLGDNGIYKINRVYRKYIKVKDENGNIVKIRIDKQPPVLAGVPDVMKKPPKGVSVDEWVRELPTRYMLLGNPVNSLRCYRPYEMIRCQTNDIRSCICSDGSVPIFKKGAPKPIEPKEWEDD